MSSAILCISASSSVILCISASSSLTFSYRPPPPSLFFSLEEILIFRPLSRSPPPPPPLSLSLSLSYYFFHPISLTYLIFRFPSFPIFFSLHVFFSRLMPFYTSLCLLLIPTLLLSQTAEHVMGSVLCAPGCFSVYRCRALRDVVPKYCKKVESAFDFLTKDMGEDRWLCTLMVSVYYVKAILHYYVLFDMCYSLMHGVH